MRCLPLLLALAVALLPGIAGAERLVVAREVCDVLPVPAEGPGVAYTPGVDAEGRFVAPADLGVPAMALNDFPIEITVDLKRRLGIPADDTLFQGVGRLGYVVVRGNEAWFNGEKLTRNEEAILFEACRSSGRNR
jgi:hypothetical protein